MLLMTADVLPEDFKKLRENAGLSQKKMAEKLGVSLSMFQKYEQGDNIPSYEVLLRMAQIFGIEIRIRPDCAHPLFAAQA